MMQLAWTHNLSTSALHAAESICFFPTRLTDQRVHSTLNDFAQALGDWIQNTESEDAGRFWSSLIGHSALIESNHDLAQTVLRKSSFRGTDQSAVTQLSGLLDDIEAAYKGLFPKFSEQLPIRSKPIQDQWLGFGQGLLAHLGRLTQKSLLATDARVVLIQPVLGGFGFSHFENNLVRIEAVLTNPLAEIPEVVRLAWLLSQLNLDLPSNSEPLGSRSLHRLAPLVMLAPTLAAAEVVELSRCDESIAELAIEHWHIPVPRDKDIHGTVVPTLMDWWETYLQTRPNWATAMQAFAKMMGISC